ncbi:sigma factor-like helix-turn-helix DNA-binding protein [Cellulosimicrobium sp. NPDC057862]|uniref:sigma factor-like helix-turn-helix DNA-binding protein n=1 Tax=Actinomycetes TaxID=1760 RepID=UPI0036723699
MVAENPVRRNSTARELADRLGMSTRTVQRVIAEPREQFEARAAQRRERVISLRREGKTYAEIAAAVGMTTGGVGTILHHARKSGVEV